MGLGRRRWTILMNNLNNISIINNYSYPNNGGNTLSKFIADYDSNSIIIHEGIIMQKKCKYCECILNELNAAKNGRNGKHFRNECKPCHSKYVIKKAAENVSLRRTKANAYARKIGKVKTYDCLICSLPCYKKNTNPLCSDKCRITFYLKKEGDCWIYTGGLNRNGYGKFGKKSAHRASYEIFKGEIPSGKYVCHSCDNPSCFNPEHLWLGTALENALDSIKKGRQRWQKIKENKYALLK
jgi:hypothetical protein